MLSDPIKGLRAVVDSEHFVVAVVNQAIVDEMLSDCMFSTEMLLHL